MTKREEQMWFLTRYSKHLYIYRHFFFFSYILSSCAVFLEMQKNSMVSNKFDSFNAFKLIY